ncbi:hypothetical protein DL96DRAFT_1470416 [Flagelloscypha sp. PMI_526]|nr:hypothetical protein DL96DRAFT_1470416 [Flagelloscypha sp. PMI_526]
MGASRLIYIWRLATDQGNNPGLISIVEKIIKDSLIERFFWNKGDFITKFSQNAVNLISDTSTPLGCPELFPKIIKVSLHQQVVYCGNSSMRRDGRWEAQKKLVRRITQITTRILPEGEGVALRFINQNVDQSLNLTFTQIGNIIEPMSWQPGGCTELGTSLKSKILEPMVYAKLNPPKLDRPLLISVITDGMPDPENPYIFADAILECGMRLEAAGYPRESVKFLIGQIGTARIGFLDSLRDNKAIEQVIYATSDQLDEKFATLHQNEGELDRWLIETLLSPIKDW